MNIDKLGNYRTRDGRIATVEKIVSGDDVDYPILGHLGNITKSWKVNGDYWGVVAHPHDLVEFMAEKIARFKYRPLTDNDPKPDLDYMVTELKNRGYEVTPPPKPVDPDLILARENWIFGDSNTLSRGDSLKTSVLEGKYDKHYEIQSRLALIKQIRSEYE